MKEYKLIFIIIIVGVLLGSSLWLVFLQPKSPLDALKREFKKNERTILNDTDLIKQIDINSENSILFYFSSKGNVNCAVSKKKFYGYKIIGIFSGLNSFDEELRVNLLGGTYKDGKKYKWLYYGIIYDNSVKKVIWNNTEALKFSTPELEMVYSMGDGKFEGDGDYNIYDSQGNEMEHWIERR